MDKRSARREGLSTWFLELSALWAVFPLLEQIVRPEPAVDWTAVKWGAGISMLTLAAGLYLKSGSEGDGTP